MNTYKLTYPKLITLSLLLLLAVGLSFLWIGQARAATLPAETCTYDLGTNTRTCEFWATTGSLTMPDAAVVTFWGYASSDPALGGLAELPGPAIIANQGEILHVILHNNLAETTSLYFAGQDVIPDLSGVVAGGTTTYTFTLTQPGTFSYEAGLLGSSQHQVAMGLFGALVVRPAGLPLQAYAGASTAFTDEALVVLNEIDPALNNLANPALFDLRNYNPRYFLINGKSYPATDQIVSTAGATVLLRYINAGLQPHTMNLLGLDQSFIGLNGVQLPYVRKVVANTVHPGQTADMLVTLPLVTPSGGGTYALYDGSFLTRNSNAAGFGGMLTHITVADGTVPSTGPTTGTVTLTPNPTNGSVDVTIQATVSGPLAVTGAEYFIGATGLGGSGLPMTALDGAFDSATEVVVGTISIADLALLAAGDHTVSVHGTDGVWGGFNFAVLHLDNLGPMVTGIILSPDPSNGSLAVSIRATADDSMSGNSNVVAAEYVIDDMNAPSGTALTVSPVAPVASLTGIIPATTMGGLTEGEHMLHIRAQDAFGNLGDWMMGVAALRVDKTGPVTSNLVLTPSLLYTRAQVRLDVNLNDALSGTPGVQSRIQKAEGFINIVGAPGTGFPLTPSDGLFNTSSEKAWATIPLSTINTLPEGINTIFVRGRDTSGNWGLTASATLTIMPQNIFADGFESGNFTRWNGGTVGAPVVTAAAARSGAFGMQVVLSGNTPRYAIDTTPTADPSYRGRFYFNPNALVTGNNNQVTIFAGLDGANNQLFRVEYNRNNQGGRVRAVVTRAGGTSTTPWVSIPNTGWTAIEISWQSATSAAFRLYTGGVLRQTLTALNTNAYKLETVWLGPSGTLANNTSGTVYFDDFVSKRTLYIGP